MFVRICMLSVLLMGALAGPAVSEGRGTAKWGEGADWQIRVDRTIGNGCFAMKLYEEGTVVVLGIDPGKKGMFLVLGNKTWQSLEAGKAYPVRFVFDDQRKYDGHLTGAAYGDAVLLIHSNVSADFTADFMERTGVRVYYRGSPIAHLSLRNTYAALIEVAKCQKEMWAAAGTAKSSVRPTSDPFSR